MKADVIERVLSDAVSSGGVAGVAAAVTTGAETIFEGMAGVTASGGAQAVTADTLFWIASMTKPITSVAAMQLVEQGKLSLDTPVREWLPQLAYPQILQADGSLRPAQTNITLRHLLTHTAGFSYSFASAELTAYIAAHNIPTSPGALASLNVPLLQEPGTKWTYGINTDFVGLAVEAASGEKLDVYFKNHITGPLGMKDTAFIPNEEQLSRTVAMHQRQADGSLTPIPPYSPRTPEFFSGGGALYSTLNDYQKFLRMMLSGGAGIISPETIAQMSVNQIGALRAGVIPSANPGVIAAMDSFPGMDTKWGLGFLINPEPGPFGRSAGSISWAGLANTYFWIDPAKGLAAVILMQLLPSGDLGAIRALIGFEAAVYA